MKFTYSLNMDGRICVEAEDNEGILSELFWKTLVAFEQGIFERAKWLYEKSIEINTRLNDEEDHVEITCHCANRPYFVCYE